MNLFEEAYKRLNVDQKRAVDTIEGPVMVIAGPGTGKTQILTLRIANILKNTDTPPSAILALTYTDAGVTAMRERLAKFIGAEAYAVRIHTYHSFAESLVKEHGEYLERLRDGVLADDVDQREILERAFDSVSAPLLTSRGDAYRGIKEVVRFIDGAKRELFTPEKLYAEYVEDEARVRGQEDFIHVKGAYKGKIRAEYVKALQKIEKNTQATSIYEAYEKILVKENRYDYQDLLLELVKALKAETEFKQILQEEFLYFLADEHQDANATQNEILLELADFHDAPNVFVVGDEKQAIYRFQGADLDTFLSLKERYSDAEIILLETNYRSTQEVLDVAHSLISKAPIPDPALRKELKAHNGAGVKVRICRAGDYEDELAQVMSFIQKLTSSGVPETDIAVLVRNNSDAFPIAGACMRAKVPFTIMAKENVLNTAFAKLYLHLLRALWKGDTVSLARALFLPGIISNGTDRLRLIEAIRKSKTTLLADIDVTSFEKGGEIDVLKGVFSELHEESHVLPAARVVPHIISKLGIVSGIAKRLDSQELYGILQALLSDIEKFAGTHPGADIGMYLERIDLIEKHELSVVSTRKEAKGIQIMTAHGSKGLEFPYVIIPFATDRRYGKKRSGELSVPGSLVQEEHDERRLLYVAITRAEKEAFITYASKNTSGREETPTRFILDMEELLEDMEGVEATLPLIGEESGTTLLDKEYIQAQLLSSGMSATAYGNYKVSPWKYFFRNLLKLPEGKTFPLIYGSAVHAALEDAGKQVFAGTKIDIEKVKEVFEEKMRLSDLTEKEKSEHIPLGKEVLSKYLEQAVFGQEGKTEFSVSAPFEIPGVGTLTIRGNLDRLDIIDGNVVRVVDYKTGKVKSENEIKGLTATADPSYYVQLMFYALLLKHDPAHKYVMKEGVLEFVEPNDTGKYVSRRFEIDEEELNTFEEEFRKDLEAIANGAFLGAPVTDDYRELVEMITLQKESGQ
jgi:DNA helicase-2/ATP-dependent DNA helicase PcrA